MFANAIKCSIKTDYADNKPQAQDTERGEIIKTIYSIRVITQLENTFDNLLKML